MTTDLDTAHKADPSAACLHCGHEVALHPHIACTFPNCDCDAFIPQEFLDEDPP